MQTPRPALIQEQRQKLSPQLVQSMQILSLPLQDLEQRIAQELEANPALEVIKEQYYESLGSDTPPEPGTDGDWENDYGSWEYSSYDTEGADAHNEFVQGALSRPESLQDHLLWQLRLNPMPDEFFQIGETLIRNLDEHGFHRERPQELIPEDRWPAMAEVMKIIQSLDPCGTCVTDVRESLLVQARQYSDMPAVVPALIHDHFQDLERYKPKELSRSLGCSEAELEEAVAFVRTLSPHPGQAFSTAETPYVLPDVMITRQDDEIVIFINDEQIPVLGVNPFFDAMLKRKDDPRETRAFVQEKLRDARWFINAVRMRNESLMKVVRAIVEFQKAFFLHGPKKIVPLTLRDIAAEIGVHEATVSRLTNGKYAQTDWGLLELKYFFSGSIAGTGGQQFTRESVKIVLREILAEHGNAALSDQKLCTLLEERGIRIARRTVAKYRSELDIASSYER